MHTSYRVYDAQNRIVETFGGPCRLAKWNNLLPGWGIERFLGDVSQGSVTMDSVRAHAAEIVAADHGHTDPQPNQMAY
jgi:hypothetical protein